MLKIQKCIVNKLGERLVFDDIIKQRSFYITQNNGKKGALNQDGIEVLKPEFDDVKVTDYNCLEVTLNSLYGLFDKDGKELIPIKCTSIINISEGMVRFTIEGKKGFASIDGQYFVEPRFDDVGFFYKGKAKVKIIKENWKEKYGYVDKAGNEIIPVEYDSISEFYEGVATTSNAGKYGYIREDGKEILKPQCNEITEFEFGFGFGRIGDDYICVDKEGKEIFRLNKYTGIKYFGEPYSLTEDTNGYQGRGILFKSGVKLIQNKEHYICITHQFADPIFVKKI